MEPFWNSKCDIFSNELWVPCNDFHKSRRQTPHWNCDNKNISFTHFKPNDEVNIDFDFEFKPIPIVDNTLEKRKLFFKMYNIEIRRLERQIKKNKIKQSNINRYLKKIKQIQTSVSKIEKDTKYKRFIVQIRKSLESLKDDARENDKVIQKHFVQTDKIYKKMERMDDVIYCKKVKIIPSQEQVDTIYHWMRCINQIYNDLVEEFNKIHNKIRKKFESSDKEIPYSIFLITELKKYADFPTNGRKLRDIKYTSYREAYVESGMIPCNMVADTILEFASRIKGNITNLVKGNIQDFTFKFRRSNNKKNYTIPIQRQNTSKKGFFSTTIGEMETEDDSFNWDDIQGDYKLVYNSYHKSYYLHIPAYRKPPEVIPVRKPIASMDPGSRTFQQLYGLDHIISIGDNLYVPIMEKMKKIEAMDTRLKNTKVHISQSTRHNLKRAIKRTHTKIKDMISELHFKTALYLCKTYDRIMVTDFSSSKVNSKKKKLNKNNKKVLGKLSHYMFRQRLSHKCKEYRCHYIEVTEEYTSQTCCNCGSLDPDIGSKKQYDCENCTLSIGRDVNASICILIKNRDEVINKIFK